MLNKTETESNLSPFSFGGVGCFDGDSKAVLYKKLYMEPNSHISDSFPINQLLVDFQVRNAADPLIAAIVLTDETLNFGMSSADLVITGCLLLFVSIVCAIRPIQHLRQVECVP